MIRRARMWVVPVVVAGTIAGGCTDDRSEPVATASAPRGGSEGTYHSETALDGRSYDLYVPASYRAGAQPPAIIAFHGRPGSPIDIRRASGLDVLADEMGFLAVFPRGENRRWEADAGGADVAYSQALIADLVDSWGADPERIFVTGFSNGADMAIVTALALPDLVAGVAAVTPSGTGAVVDVIRQLAAPVPVIAFIGESDERADLGLDMLEAWRAAVGCSETDSGYTTDEVTSTTWTCDGTPFRVDLVSDQGHVWFGHPTAREPLWASAAMWAFFDDLG